MLIELLAKVQHGILTPDEAIGVIEDIAESYGRRGLHTLADHYWNQAKRLSRWLNS